MAEVSTTKASRATGWGWGVLVVIAGLFLLNGVSWIFVGPEAAASDMAENIGLSITDFEETHPAAIEEITVNQYQTATYLMAIGAMGLVAALAGLRKRSRWGWKITWVLVAVPVALVVGGLAAGFDLSGFVAMMFLLATIALTGQLLAGTGSE